MWFRIESQSRLLSWLSEHILMRRTWSQWDYDRESFKNEWNLVFFESQNVAVFCSVYAQS